MQTHTFSKKTIAVAIAAGTAFTGVVAPAQHLPTTAAAGELKPVDASVVTGVSLSLDTTGEPNFYDSYPKNKPMPVELARKYNNESTGNQGTSGFKRMYVTYTMDIAAGYSTGSFEIKLPGRVSNDEQTKQKILTSDNETIGEYDIQYSKVAVTMNNLAGVKRTAKITIPVYVSINPDVVETQSTCADTDTHPAVHSMGTTTVAGKTYTFYVSGTRRCEVKTDTKPKYRINVNNMYDLVPGELSDGKTVTAPSMNSPTVDLTKYETRIGLPEKLTNKGNRRVTITYTFDENPTVNLKTGSFRITPTETYEFTDKLYNPRAGKNERSVFDSLKDANNYYKDLTRDVYLNKYKEDKSPTKTYAASGKLDNSNGIAKYTLTVDVPENEGVEFDLIKNCGTVSWDIRKYDTKAKVAGEITNSGSGGTDGYRKAQFTVPLTPGGASGTAEFKYALTADALVNNRSADTSGDAVVVARGGQAEFDVKVTNTGNIGTGAMTIKYPAGFTDTQGKTSRTFNEGVRPGASRTYNLGKMNVPVGLQSNTFTVSSSNKFPTVKNSAWTNVDSRTMAEIAASAGGSFAYPVGHVVFDDPVNKSHDGVIAPVNLDAKNVKSIDIDKSGVPDFVQVGVDKDGKEGTNGNIIFLVSPQKPDLTNMHNIVYIPVTATYKDGSVAKTTATILLGEYERYVTNVEKNDAGDYVVTSNWGEQWTISLSDIRKLIADNKAAIDVLKKDNDKNKATIEQLKRDTKANADKIKDLEGRVKKNEDAIKALQDKDKAHDKALKDLDERVKNNENRISDLEKRVTELRTDVNQNTKDIAALEGKVSKVEKELETERNERIAADSALQGQIDTLVKDVTKAKETLSDHEKRITDLEKRVAKNEGDITSIKKQIGDINAEISSIKTDINNKYNTLNTMVENLDKRVTNNTEEINNLKTRMTKVEGDIIDINNRIDGINIKIGDIENKLNKEIQDRKDGDNKLSLRIDGVDKRVTDIDARVTNLTNVVNEGNNVNKEEITKIKNEISSIKNDITSLRNDVNKNTTNITNLDKRVTEIEGRVTNVENRVTNLEGRIGVLESTNKKWAQCYSGIGIAALPALLSIPLWGLGNAQIPAIQQFNTDVQKQIGMFNPELAAFVENTGAVQIIATILGVASAIGLVAYAANECRPYNETNDAKDTPLGSMSSDMYQAFDPDGKGSSDADAEADAK